MIPIILFAYARPDHMRRTLDGLRANQVPLIYAFSDGPRTPDKAPAVAEVRQVLRAIDWCFRAKDRQEVHRILVKGGLIEGKVKVEAR